jgi:hypothetical protein
MRNFSQRRFEMNCFTKETKMNVAKGTGLFLFSLLFLACGGAPAPAPASPPEELDVAIRETSDYLNEQLPEGNKLVILNIHSEFPALSEYIIDELIANTVNDRVFSVVDRQQLDTIRAELDFQTSGEVDDATAQALGRLAGAQSIISGAVSRIGDLYRLRVRALSVQTAQIEGQFNRNIPDGSTIAALMRSQATGYGGGALAARTPQGAAPVSAPVVPASDPVVSAVPATVPEGQTPAASASEPAAILVQAEPAQPATPVPVSAQTSAAPSPAYNTGETGPAGGTIFYPVVRTTSVPPANTQNYKVGDTGPAGGIIFYVNPNAGEWKYLEAAPASTEGKSLQWSVSAFDTGANRVEVGTGKQNTQNIMDTSVQVAVNAPAARLCDRLEYNGYDDWYLPSKNELGLMYMNLKVDGIGGFSGDWYWSSSETGSNQAWAQNFGSGAQNGEYYRSGGKSDGHNVRAIRQF